MLRDFTLEMAVPPDAYARKRDLWRALGAVGLPVEERGFLYSRSPINGSLILRSDDARVAAISTVSRPVMRPEIDRHYDFWLRASPCFHDRRVCFAADPQEWLLRRVAEIGVEIQISHHRVGWTWCGKPTGMRNGFRMLDVVFVGNLVVRDADKLNHALTSGVGRHRAFGFGLLQLFAV